MLSAAVVGAILIRNRKKHELHEEFELDSPLIIKEAAVMSPIGSGNFGTVYKGTAFGGTEVALKLMKAEEKEIMAEASILTRVHHVRNLFILLIVSLIAYDSLGYLKKRRKYILLWNIAVKAVC